MERILRACGGIEFGGLRFSGQAKGQYFTHWQQVYLPAILDRSRSTLPFLSKLKWGDVECIVSLSNNEGETATRTNCR